MTVCPTQFLQALPESRKASLSFPIVCSRTHKHANTAHAFARLCGRNERHHSRTADERDELASSHCVPSGQRQGIVSAKTSTLEGAINVRFRPLAELSQVSIMSTLPLKAGIATSRLPLRQTSKPTRRKGFLRAWYSMSALGQKRTSGSFKNNKLDFAESADKAPSRKSRTHSSHLGEA